MKKSLIGTLGANYHIGISHQSGAPIFTDTEIDSAGTPLGPSPTDLLVIALGTCMLTTVAMVLGRSGISLAGSWFEASKKMGQKPVKVESITLEFHLPKSINPTDYAKVTRAFSACPIHRSLHPDIQVVSTIAYDL